MPWHSSFPVGTISVKANKAIGQDNTDYIQATMGNAANNTRDHFWNVSPDTDGYHRTVNMPAQGGHPPPATVAMEGIFYCKLASADVARVEGFYCNAQGKYQFTPSFLQGTATVNSSYGTVVAVPKNVYGEIVMFTDALGKSSMQTGFFRSDGTSVEAWAYKFVQEGSDNSVEALKFADGADVSGLNIRARTQQASSGQTWNYRITYRAITN